MKVDCSAWKIVRQLSPPLSVALANKPLQVNMTSIAAIIPWRNRTELEISLKHHGRRFSELVNDIVISNCGGSRETLAAILSQVPEDTVRMVDAPSQEFNKCLAANVGAANTNANILLFLDADIILSDSFLEEALDGLRSHSVSVLGIIQEVNQTPEINHDDNVDVDVDVDFEISHSVSITSGTSRATVMTNRLKPFRKSRLGLGVAMIDRETFIKINGYNSALSGWGWEDVDLLMRAQFVTGKEICYVGAGYHLTHGDEVRDLRGVTREVSEFRNYQRCIAAYSGGDYNGTFEADSASCDKKFTVVSNTPRTELHSGFD